MRRPLILILLLLLPFQLSWAAVAGYCQHEQGISAHHPGHHEHKHQGAASQDSAPDSSPDPSPAGSVDNDCGTCHASCGMAPLAATEMALARHVALAIPWLPALHASPPRAQPERPNWSRLA